jgi:predicted DCC family thiol-disulfide oxidoreductase YuxK
MPHPIILYDGICGLCNRVNQFVLRRDPEGVFRFASLQSAVAGRILARHGANPEDLDTVYVVVDYELPEERLLPRSDAVIFILKQLGAAELRSSGQPRACPEPVEGAAVPTQTQGSARIWRLAGLVLQLVPRPVREWGYRLVARNRYLVFGRFDSCMLPSPEHRSLFLDD